MDNKKSPKSIMEKGGVAVSKINKDIENLTALIEDAPGLLGFSFIKDDDAIVIINKIQSELPDEIATAQDIVSRRDNIVSEANQRADNIIAQADARAAAIIEAAEREAERLVSDTYVMKKANQEANDAIMDATKQAKSAIAYANNYVEGAFDSILNGIDYLKNDTMDAKHKIVNQLQSSESRYNVADDRNYQSYQEQAPQGNPYDDSDDDEYVGYDN